MLKNMYSDQSFFGNVPFDSALGTRHSCLSLYQSTFWTCPNCKCLQTTKEMHIKTINLVLTRKKNSSGKGENAGYQIESTCIQKKKCNLKI